ncbi:hypothetical protein [Paraburkholderia terrae]|nr:hypothetical protein [Paraburkholderia terrae]
MNRESRGKSVLTALSSRIAYKAATSGQAAERLRLTVRQVERLVSRYRDP